MPSRMREKTGLSKPRPEVPSEHSQQYMEVLTQLEEQESHIKELEVITDQTLQHLESRKEEAMQSIEKRRKEMLEELDKRQKLAVETFVTETKKVTEKKSDFRYAMVQLKDSRIKVEEAVDTGEEARLLDTLNSIQKVIEEVAQVKPLDVDTKDVVDDVFDIIQQPLEQQVDLTRPIELVSAGSVNISTKEDKKVCNIKGLATLDDNRLVISDAANSNIKLTDDQWEVMDVHKLSNDPWDIVCFPEDQVAVSLPSNREVQIFGTSGMLSFKRSIRLRMECYGLALCGDQLVVSCKDWDANRATVEILSAEDGQPVRSIERGFHGEVLFNTPWSLVAEEDWLYVADSSMNTILQMTLEGHDTIKKTSIGHPISITIDPFGVLYVCCQKSNTIQYLTPTMTKLKTVLERKDGLKSPRAICYSNTKNQLVVGMSHSNDLHIYQR